MAASPRLIAQINLIQQAHPDAGVAPDGWENSGEVDYIYQKNVLLTNALDLPRVTKSLDRRHPVQEEEAARGQWYVLERLSENLTLIRLLPLPGHRLLSVPELLFFLDAEVGQGTVTPNHLVWPCPYPCPATEPEQVPGSATPVPPPASDGQCDGAGVYVSIVDTGWLTSAASHPWLAGVTGTPEDPYNPNSGDILPYAGHGTFVAGCVRCMAPEATVSVAMGFDSGTGAFESDLEPILEAALDPTPGIFLFTFCSATRNDLSLKTFDDLYERRISQLIDQTGLVVIAPAGNDGKSRPMWPAAYQKWVTSVGALSADGQNKADFSNYGNWVDVYTPGEDLVNAFATGLYVCDEPPNTGQQRTFAGMAKWSGTSFSTPIFAGLVAARMSSSGENGQQAAASLVQLAQGQLVDGTYPALYPGQACLDLEGV